MTTALAPSVLDLDARDRGSLDGIWEFFPGDHDRSELDQLTPAAIEVPGLWEAQGYLELDGTAWYRRRFHLPYVDGHWTLRFGAVMDLADVFLNAEHIGSHAQPFTPFELPVTHALCAGVNVLDVRVTDPPLEDPQHVRMAHGKQGWANHVFPSRPSLYLTYGGIWQPVSLRRHGPLVLSDVFVNSDPDDLQVRVEVENVAAEETWGLLGLRTLDRVQEHVVRLGPGESTTVTSQFGSTPAPRWSPEQPALHQLLVEVKTDVALSDRRQIRYGLRTIRLDGTRMLINDVPYRMKSVLVQGFRAEQLYAEGSREQIIDEVKAAKAMGFNTVRLHIKAFDPTYLRVCDELGMLVHSDLPIAEPIAHDELGDGTPLSECAIEAITEQVRRDRNHPSIILWSAMNELGLDRAGVRESPVYEQFARTMYAAVSSMDPTRPVIENDWVEPHPDRVFCSPILTAHWYGRLHSEYLDKLDAACRQWADAQRPLYVTEFGDWGLPTMPETPAAPFWDPREIYAAGLAATLWPASIGRFVRETQRYQGLSDRLQIEVFRRHDHVGGYCVTELTDVPHELNGLLDLHRQPKPPAVEEIRRANQPTLPMLHLDSLVVYAGEYLRAPLHIANDGPALSDVQVHIRFGGTMAANLDRVAAFDATALSPARIEARFGECEVAVRVGSIEADRSVVVGDVTVLAPRVAGNHDLLLILSSGAQVISENRYPIHIVTRTAAPYDVQSRGDGDAVLQAVGARCGATGPLVVAEGALDVAAGTEARLRLDAGETVVVLAQDPAKAAHYPVPTELANVETAWGSSVFHFTTDSGALPSLPRRNVLVAEESTIQAHSAVVRIAGGGFPHEPVVIAYKPVPGSITGWIVGCHHVGAGRLICCQYRLARRVLEGDTAARALLADILRWAAHPREPTARLETVKPDGRSLTYYAYPEPS
ncbi:MAG: glycoside hydrolase family 2 protein [Actinomycetes bacterium]